jgi:type IV secretion system protein VirB9
MADQPITTDSRIKTFVYNANEVFSITTHYGYQSNVEFGTKETIETVSVGDRVGWQIIPAGRRLFIRAMEENAHTNMTIVTNQRAYQFDLRSSGADAVFGSEALTYVVRFFYADDVASGAPMPTTSVSDVSPLLSQPMGYQPPANYGATSPATPAYPVASASIAAAPLPAAPTVAAPVTNSNAPAAVNYRYTYSGPNDIAPVKIYDDGRSTYFKFSGNGAPRIAVITARGETIDVPSRRTGDGLVAVDVVAPRLSIYQSGRQVVVYNEAAG